MNKRSFLEALISEYPNGIGPTRPARRASLDDL